MACQDYDRDAARAMAESNRRPCLSQPEITLPTRYSVRRPGLATGH
jgi:hypothetical protein